jgi:hypothetical protein
LEYFRKKWSSIAERHSNSHLCTQQQHYSQNPQKVSITRVKHFRKKWSSLDRKHWNSHLCTQHNYKLYPQSLNHRSCTFQKEKIKWERRRHSDRHSILYPQQRSQSPQSLNRKRIYNACFLWRNWEHFRKFCFFFLV